MVLATGASWRIGFAPNLPLVDGARPYDLLWLGAVRWLLRDASTERLVLETAKATHAIGEDVELRLRTFSASYAPEGGVEVEWALRPLDGPPAEDGAGGKSLPEDPSAAESRDSGKDFPRPPGRSEDAPHVDPSEGAIRGGRWVSDDLGKATETLSELGAGAYEATAWPARSDPEAGAPSASESTTTHELARRVFLIGSEGVELDQVDADPGRERLRRLAEQGGGEFVDLGAGESLPRSFPVADQPAEGGPLEGRRDVPLWDGWLALLLLLIAYPGEWWLRRRHGKA
jgi:hypothetical protein